MDPYAKALASGSAQSFRDDDGEWWVGTAPKADDAHEVETRNGRVGLTLWWDHYWYAGEPVSYPGI